MTRTQLRCTKKASYVLCFDDCHSFGSLTTVAYQFVPGNSLGVDGVGDGDDPDVGVETNNGDSESNESNGAGRGTDVEESKKQKSQMKTNQR